jgi:hypothetical protein
MNVVRDPITQFTRLDVTLLRQQKLELLTIPETAISKEQMDAINGVIGILDVIQDQMVEDGDATEEEVFGPKDADGRTELQRYE